MMPSVPKKGLGPARKRLRPAPMLTEANRAVEGLDVWVIENFSRDVLGLDAVRVIKALKSKYPTVDAGKQIQWGKPQWVQGTNKFLMYRGTALKREKMWLQLTNPSETKTFTRYFYTGWQWGVLPATSWVGNVADLELAVGKLNKWCSKEGYPRTNHFIVTRYEDHHHSIGAHFDKARSIQPRSLIIIIKAGEAARPFELKRLDGSLILNKVLQPGTAVVMTLEANLKTKHSVPALDYKCGPSGSIVARTITEEFSFEETRRRINKGVAKKARDTVKKARDTVKKTSKTVKKTRNTDKKALKGAV